MLRILTFIFSPLILVHTLTGCADRIADPELEKVTVAEVNRAPVLVNDSVVVQHSIPAFIHVLENDTDVNGPLQISTLEFTQPRNGVAASVNDSVLVYVALDGILGPDSFTYTIEDDFGVRSEAAVVALDVVIGPPWAPELRAPESGTRDAPIYLTLSWGSTRFADAYELQIARDGDFSAPVLTRMTADLEFLAGPLEKGVWYSWRIRGVNSVGAGAWSAEWSFQTIPGIPGVPDLILPEDNAGNVRMPLIMQWSAEPPVTFYQLQIADNRAFGGAVVNQEVASDTFRIEEGVLERESRYYWRVRATNSGGTGPWSVTWSFVTQNRPPDVPDLLLPENQAMEATLRPLLEWQTVDLATSYEVHLASTRTFSQMISNIGTETTGLQVAEGLLAHGKQYYWRVRAYRDDIVGEWSETYWFEISDSF